MKGLKKFIAAAVMATSSIFCLAACGSNPVSTKISPVEDSGETVACTAVQSKLPKGWTEVKSSMQYDGFNISKGILNSVSVIVIDGADDTIDLNEYVDQLKQQLEATGVTVNDAELRKYDFGEGVYLSATGQITQELVDSNVAAGMCTEEQAKQLKGVVGKNKNESIIYFIENSKLIAVDGVTLGDDAAGIAEVTEFIGNNLKAVEQ